MTHQHLSVRRRATSQAISAPSDGRLCGGSGRRPSDPSACDTAAATARARSRAVSPGSSGTTWWTTPSVARSAFFDLVFPYRTECPHGPIGKLKTGGIIAAVSVPLAASRSQYRFSRDQDGRIQSNGVSAAPCLPAEGQEPSASRNAGKAWSGRGVAWLHSKSYRLPVHSISSIQEEFFSERKPCSGCRVIVSVIGTKTPSYRPLRGPFALGPFL